jgi:uncharacterized membrane protein
MKKIQHFAFFISVLYLTVYAPIFWATYFPAWYELNCKWHGRCLFSGPDQGKTHIRELTGFLRHTGKLAHPDWSAKEKRHLTEVRMMLDMMLAGAVAAVSVFFLTFDRRRLGRIVLLNAGIMLFSATILPFFKTFWRHGFHEMFFDNTDWINFPTDVTYAITPRVFFLNTFIFVISAALIINLCCWMILRGRNRQNNLFH